MPDYDEYLAIKYIIKNKDFEGGVKYMKTKDIEIERLNEEKKRLKEENEAKDIEIERLKGENEAKDIEIERLKEENKRLKEEKKKLKEEYKRLHKRRKEENETKYNEIQINWKPSKYVIQATT